MQAVGLLKTSSGPLQSELPVESGGAVVGGSAGGAAASPPAPPLPSSYLLTAAANFGAFFFYALLPATLSYVAKTQNCAPALVGGQLISLPEVSCSSKQYLDLVLPLNLSYLYLLFPLASMLLLLKYESVPMLAFLTVGYRTKVPLARVWEIVTIARKVLLVALTAGQIVSEVGFQISLFSVGIFSTLTLSASTRPFLEPVLNLLEAMGLFCILVISLAIPPRLSANFSPGLGSMLMTVLILASVSIFSVSMLVVAMDSACCGARLNTAFKKYLKSRAKKAGGESSAAAAASPSSSPVTALASPMPTFGTQESSSSGAESSGGALVMLCNPMHQSGVQRATSLPSEQSAASALLSSTAAALQGAEAARALYLPGSARGAGMVERRSEESFSVANPLLLSRKLHSSAAAAAQEAASAAAVLASLRALQQLRSQVAETLAVAEQLVAKSSSAASAAGSPQVALLGRLSSISERLQLAAAAAASSEVAAAVPSSSLEEVEESMRAMLQLKDQMDASLVAAMRLSSAKAALPPPLPWRAKAMREDAPSQSSGGPAGSQSWTPYLQTREEGPPSASLSPSAPSSSPSSSSSLAEALPADSAVQALRAALAMLKEGPASPVLPASPVPWRAEAMEAPQASPSAATGSAEKGGPLGSLWTLHR